MVIVSVAVHSYGARGTVKHLLIRASAGSGKTYQLSNRLLGLLLQGIPVDRILATTFTRKAAAEIASRVLIRLARAASSDAEASLLNEALGASATITDYQRLLGRCVRALHRFSILTLDSLCVQLTQTAPLSLGLPPEWRILDPSELDEIRSAVIATVIASAPPAELLSLLTLLKRGDATRSIHQTLIGEIAALEELYEDTKHASWSFATPSHKGSAEPKSSLLERLDTIVVPTSKSGAELKSWRSALDELRAALLRNDFESVLSKGLGKALIEGKDSFSRHPLTDEIREALQPVVSRAARELLQIHKGVTLATRDLLERYHETYRDYVAARAVLRFSDVKTALADNEEHATMLELLRRLDARFDHLLLDEFQDTSRQEWQILEPLATEILSASADRSFFCVGDVKQAIYGWRGGVAELFDELEERYNEALSVVESATSYRSAPEVIDVVNTVFSSLSKAPSMEAFPLAARAWQQRFALHETARTDLCGYVGAKSTDEPLRHACELTSRLARENPELTIGVLFRRNKQVPEFLRTLSAPPFGQLGSEEGGNPLTDSGAVRIALSALTLAAHPGDSFSSFHIRHTPLVHWRDFDTQVDDVHRSSCIRRHLLQGGLAQTLEEWRVLLAPCLDAFENARFLQLIDYAVTFDEEHPLDPGLFVNRVLRRRVDNPQTRRIRAMTIHQSKGLEFDAVILPELDIPLCGAVTPRVLTAAETAVAPATEVVRYPRELLRRIHPPFEALYQNDREATVAESLNLLYVALTRARRGLFLLLPAGASESDKSFAGILRYALLRQSESFSSGNFQRMMQ